MPYIPHTDDDVARMLEVIGADSIDALFDEIPEELKASSLGSVPPALTEMEITRLMNRRASEDGQLLTFIGAGAYEHHIPAPVWAIATRGELYSAYTPYQAEASQGTLQLIYEFQSMMCALTAMDVSNASLYDGASALAEACLMAVRTQRTPQTRRILLPRTVNPTYGRVARAITHHQDLSFEPVDYDPRAGVTRVAALEAALAKGSAGAGGAGRAAGSPGAAPGAAPGVAPGGPGAAALVIQQPNFFGNLEEVDALTDWAHRHGIKVIAVVNPSSLALLKPPGEWGSGAPPARGADIACGEGQPLGVPLASGGPYFGFMTTRTSYVRQMPGRIVGRTVDLDGRPGFTLTLQAREQHIRRSKATSNICTNQGLLVTAATVYLSLLGAAGLERVARACVARTAELVQALTRVPGVRPVFESPRFHEAVLRLDRPVKPVLAKLEARGIAGGLDLSESHPELGSALLVCATETKLKEDIERYARTLADILKEQR